MAKKNLLFEIGLEDLPAKNLNIFSEKIKKNIENNFLKNQITFRSIDNFYTNLRLVFFVNDIEENIIKQKIKAKVASADFPQGDDFSDLKLSA